MQDKDKLELLDIDTSPRNADEFFMGMYLALILNLIEEEDFDGLSQIMDDAEKVLVYWRNKYDEDIMIAGGNSA